MKISAWIQHWDNESPDFLIVNGAEISPEDKNERELYMRKIFGITDEKKKVKKFAHSVIFESKKMPEDFVIQLTSDDTDDAGRKGAVTLLIENFSPESQTDFNNEIKKIFRITNTKVSDEIIEELWDTLKKKSSQNLFENLNVAKISIAILFLSALIYLFYKK